MPASRGVASPLVLLLLEPLPALVVPGPLLVFPPATLGVLVPSVLDVVGRPPGPGTPVPGISCLALILGAKLASLRRGSLWPTYAVGWPTPSRSVGSRLLSAWSSLAPVLPATGGWRAGGAPSPLFGSEGAPPEVARVGHVGVGGSGSSCSRAGDCSWSVPLDPPVVAHRTCLFTSPRSARWVCAGGVATSLVLPLTNLGGAPPGAFRVGTVVSCPKF